MQSRGTVNWRSKSSPRGLFSGFYRRGCLDLDWGGFFKGIEALRSRYPARDYLLASNGRPMTYTCCLSHFRRCLISYGGSDRTSAGLFTLHSLKATLLAWSQQLGGVADADKAAQGHHRCPAAGISRCVPKYGRDDVVPQLRCQERLLVALDKGWMPKIPLDRGVHELELQLRAPSPAAPADDTAATESESSQSDASSSLSSDEEFDASDCCVDIQLYNPAYLKGRGFLMCARAFRTKPAFLGPGQCTDWHAVRRPNYMTAMSCVSPILVFNDLHPAGIQAVAAVPKLEGSSCPGE